MSRRGAADFGSAALAVRRLAVMLDAGLSPESAWRQLAAADATADTGASAVRPGVAVRVVAAIDEGTPLATAIADALAEFDADLEAVWAPVAAAWRVAEVSGAPLAPTLDRLARVLAGLDESAREVEVALAGPTASARIVTALPVVGILFGLAIGADTIATLFTTGPGLVCLVVGLGLMAGGALWSRRLVRSARSTDATPGLPAELTAVAVSSGLGAERARELVDAALDQTGLHRSGDAVAEAIAFSRRAGVPAAALLRAGAEQERGLAATGARRRAAALGVRLMLPLGVCVLPAFLALGVLPVVLSLVSSTARVL
ncbi:type II secretion system F family protein [Schumannella sp. 10F1B-5-1]|uniref:type II secretion system F family protein n=1 Tax=Schumannella sp. 10F1B-5-1 TaxID=2590780 RepID=UPI001C63D66A|nr:type II secretion system F family protein [Schumannella sp. 10F1B-5-1]